MSTKVLNRRQARWAELLTDYDFILIHTSGKRNPANGPSHQPNYTENPLPTGSLIASQALRFLPSIPLTPALSTLALSTPALLTLTLPIPTPLTLHLQPSASINALLINFVGGPADIVFNHRS